MAEIQQLVKRDPSSGSYETIFPTTYLDAVYDRESGTPLTEILNGFNMYFLSYVGSTQNTRLQVPPSVRRLGLWISYVQYDGSVVTEWYKGTLVDDISFASNDNWNIGSNSLVGDISISAGGNWVINGVDSGAPARGEAGISPIVIIENNKFRVSFDRGDSYIDLSQTPVFTQFRVHDNKLEQSVDLGATWIVVSDELAYQFRNSGNKLQVSKDLGVTWEDTSDYIAAWFKFTSVADGGGIDNIGKIQISRDNGSTWVDLSGVFTTNFTIKGYVATVGALPTGAAQGDVYGVGPTYDPADTGQINPIYELYVKDSTGWVNNGRFTSITAGVVQVTGQSTTEVMSQKAVTDELTAINSDVADLELEQIQGGVYDVSSHNDGAVFESLSTLLGSANLSTLIHTSVRRGGMSIRFIQGSVSNPDNKYVQWRFLLSGSFTNAQFTTTYNWQKEDLPSGIFVKTENTIISSLFKEMYIEPIFPDSFDITSVKKVLVYRGRGETPAWIVQFLTENETLLANFNTTDNPENEEIIILSDDTSITRFKAYCAIDWEGIPFGDGYYRKPCTITNDCLNLGYSPSVKMYLDRNKIIYNLPSVSYASLSAAIADIDAADRDIYGISVRFYNTTSGQTELWMYSYIGEQYNWEVNFTNVSNWRRCANDVEVDYLRRILYQETFGLSNSVTASEDNRMVRVTGIFESGKDYFVKIDGGMSQVFSLRAYNGTTFVAYINNNIYAGGTYKFTAPADFNILELFQNSITEAGTATLKLLAKGEIDKILQENTNLFGSSGVSNTRTVPVGNNMRNEIIGNFKTGEVYAVDLYGTVTSGNFNLDVASLEDTTISILLTNAQACRTIIVTIPSDANKIRILRNNLDASKTITLTVKKVEALRNSISKPSFVGPLINSHQGINIPNEINGGSPRAWRKAAELGYKWLECDIQFTSDNVAVFFHDIPINSVHSYIVNKSDGTPVSPSSNIRISDLTLPQLKSTYRWADGGSILTLVEGFNLLSMLGMNCRIEVKAYPDSNAKLDYLKSACLAFGVEKICYNATQTDYEIIFGNLLSLGIYRDGCVSKAVGDADTAENRAIIEKAFKYAKEIGAIVGIYNMNGNWGINNEYIQQLIAQYGVRYDSGSWGVTNSQFQPVSFVCDLYAPIKDYYQNEKVIIDEMTEVDYDNYTQVDSFDLEELSNVCISAVCDDDIEILLRDANNVYFTIAGNVNVGLILKAGSYSVQCKGTGLLCDLMVRY